jgi:hypothetical protein
VRSLREHIKAVQDRQSHFNWDENDLRSLTLEDVGHVIRVEDHRAYPPDTPMHELEVQNQDAHRKSVVDASEETRTAHGQYKGSSSSYFNTHLRTGTHTDTHLILPKHTYGLRHFAAMDRVTGHPTIKPMSTYRGFYGQTDHVRDLPVGHVLVDHGYTGTSHNMATARGFADGGTNWNKPDIADPRSRKKTLAMIHIPPGTMGHHLDLVTTHWNGTPVAKGQEHLQGEAEFVLHRGTHFRVMGHTVSKSPWVPVHFVHLQVIGQHPKPLMNHEGDTVHTLKADEPREPHDSDHWDPYA